MIIINKITLLPVYSVGGMKVLTNLRVVSGLKFFQMGVRVQGLDTKFNRVSY